MEQIKTTTSEGYDQRICREELYRERFLLMEMAQLYK
jgi:hypothetical protein